MNKGLLQEITTKIDALLERQETVIVSVCGGSCTRKSSLVSAELSAYYSDHAICISQDRFQRPLEYSMNMHPVYRWDHPDNFSIQECYKALHLLKSGKGCMIPDYQFKKDEIIKHTWVSPARVIIFEGLYAQYGVLSDINDVSIYVKSRWYERMIRRLCRNTLDRYKGRSEKEILSGFINSVTKAHKVFVRSQECYSDWTVYIPLDFQSICDLYAMKPIDMIQEASHLSSVRYARGIDMCIYKSNDNILCAIRWKGEYYLVFEIDSLIADDLSTIDLLEY